MLVNAHMIDPKYHLKHTLPLHYFSKVKINLDIEHASGSNIFKPAKHIWLHVVVDMKNKEEQCYNYGLYHLDEILELFKNIASVAGHSVVSIFCYSEIYLSFDEVVSKFSFVICS